MDGIGANFRRLELVTRCLTAIAENASEAVSVFSLDGILLYANSAWAKMHGYETSRGLTGKHISVFNVQVQMGTELNEFLEEVKKRGRLTGPMEHKKSDGTKFTATTTLVKFKDGAGKAAGFVVFASEARKSEGAGQDKDVLQGEIEKYRIELKKKSAEIQAAERRFAEHLAARVKAEQELDLCQHELENLKGELSQTRELLKCEEARHAEVTKSHTEEIAVLKQTSERLHNEIAELKHREVEYLDDILDDEDSNGPSRGLDTEELKALSAMARKYVQA